MSSSKLRNKSSKPKPNIPATILPWISFRKAVSQLDDVKMNIPRVMNNKPDINWINDLMKAELILAFKKVLEDPTTIKSFIKGCSEVKVGCGQLLA